MQFILFNSGTTYFSLSLRSFRISHRDLPIGALKLARSAYIRFRVSHSILFVTYFPGKCKCVNAFSRYLSAHLLIYSSSSEELLCVDSENLLVAGSASAV